MRVHVTPADTALLRMRKARPPPNDVTTLTYTISTLNDMNKERLSFTSREMTDC